MEVLILHGYPTCLWLWILTFGCPFIIISKGGTYTLTLFLLSSLSCTDQSTVIHYSPVCLVWLLSRLSCGVVTVLLTGLSYGVMETLAQRYSKMETGCGADNHKWRIHQPWFHAREGVVLGRCLDIVESSFGRELTWMTEAHNYSLWYAGKFLSRWWFQKVVAQSIKHTF